MTRVLRELWLFFWRDLSIARTYRTVFVLEAIEALFGAAMFYYEDKENPSLRLLHSWLRISSIKVWFISVSGGRGWAGWR